MMCVCDKIDWMENGWMENGLSGCGKWKVESGKWRGSGSHTSEPIDAHAVIAVTHFTALHGMQIADAV